MIKNNTATNIGHLLRFTDILQIQYHNSQS